MWPCVTWWHPLELTLRQVLLVNCRADGQVQSSLKGYVYEYSPLHWAKNHEKYSPLEMGLWAGELQTASIFYKYILLDVNRWINFIGRREVDGQPTWVGNGCVTSFFEPCIITWLDLMRRQMLLFMSANSTRFRVWRVLSCALSILWFSFTSYVGRKKHKL